MPNRYAVKVRARNVNGWGSWSTRSDDMETLPEVVEPTTDASAGDDASAAAGDAASDGAGAGGASDAGGSGVGDGKGKGKGKARSPVVGASTSPTHHRADRGSFFLGGASFAKELARRAAHAIGLEEEEEAAAKAQAKAEATGPTSGGADAVGAGTGANGAARGGDAVDERRTRLRRQSSVLMGAAGVRYKDSATRAVAQSADMAASDVLRRALMNCSIAYTAAAARVQGVPAPPPPPKAGGGDATAVAPPPLPVSAADMASAGDIAGLEGSRVAVTRRCM